MASLVMDQLDRFGPEHCEQLTLAQARQWAADLAISHYENFSVLSTLLPRPLRPHFACVYAFCRWADDLGDEAGDPRRSMHLLDWWRDELARCYANQPRHPVFVALVPTIEQFQIPAKPFEDLIDAFVQDQSVQRYQTWAQVVDYCTRSADPVGRLVLYMCGHRDIQRQQLSDQTCTALQLVNFWQDIRRDILERDRIYVPTEVLARHKLSHDDLIAHVRGEKTCDARPVIRELMDRTWPLFDKGAELWPLLEREIRPVIRLFWLGGRSVMRKIERMDYRTLDRRPALSKATKLRLIGRALVGRWTGA